MELISHPAPAAPAAGGGDSDADGNQKSSNDDCTNERDADDHTVRKSDRRRRSLQALPCPREGRAQRPGSGRRSRRSRS